MSEAGRDDVWTDLEQLLKEGKLGADSSADPCADAGTAVEAVDEAYRGDSAAEERSGLPFEDLLSELLGSWEDGRAGQTAGDDNGDAGETQVSLPDLMARLMEGPETSEVETVQSLEALQQRLSQEPLAVDPHEPRLLDEWVAVEAQAVLQQTDPPAEDEAADLAPCAEVISDDLPAPALDEASTAGEAAQLQQTAPPAEDEAADAAPCAEVISDDLLAPVLDEASTAGEAAQLLEAAPPVGDKADETETASEPCEAAPRTPVGFGDLPAPGLRSRLLESLLSGLNEADTTSLEIPAQTTPDLTPGETGGWAQDLLAALVQADEGSLQVENTEERGGEPAPPSEGWEALALLPAPAPSSPVESSLTETILFEPPLPPDSVFDWPVVEQREAIGGQSLESGPVEETESGSEHEVDDSLRRLVGLMLAEIAASASPSEQTPSAETSTDRTTERFLSFSLAGEVYAVDLAGILETDRLPRITRVPGLPAWAIGVSNLRGTILPVVDLRRLLNLEESENPSEGRILVARPVAGDSPAALVVDRLEGVALLAPSELHPAPQWLDSKILPYLEGIGSFKGRLVNVLDLGRLFSATGVNGEEPARTSEAA